MTQEDRYITGLSAIWASFKMHDLASVQFLQRTSTEPADLPFNAGVVGSVVFAAMVLAVSITIMKQTPSNRRGALWLLCASLVLGLPVAISQKIVGVRVSEVICVMALATAIIAYCWTIWRWSKGREGEIKDRLLGAVGIIVLLILPIFISWAAAYTGVLA